MSRPAARRFLRLAIKEEWGIPYPREPATNKPERQRRSAEAVRVCDEADRLLEVIPRHAYHDIRRWATLEKAREIVKQYARKGI